MRIHILSSYFAICCESLFDVKSVGILIYKEAAVQCTAASSQVMAIYMNSECGSSRNYLILCESLFSVRSMRIFIYKEGSTTYCYLLKRRCFSISWLFIVKICVCGLISLLAKQRLRRRLPRRPFSFMPSNLGCPGWNTRRYKKKNCFSQQKF